MGNTRGSADGEGDLARAFSRVLPSKVETASDSERSFSDEEDAEPDNESSSPAFLCVRRRVTQVIIVSYAPSINAAKSASDTG